jgi:hypothetical protein
MRARPPQLPASNQHHPAHTLPDAGCCLGTQPEPYQALGLASTAPVRNQAQPTKPEEDFSPIHEIVKQVGFGHLTNDPNKLAPSVPQPQCTECEPEPYPQQNRPPHCGQTRFRNELTRTTEGETTGDLWRSRAAHLIPTMLVWCTSEQ